MNMDTTTDELRAVAAAPSGYAPDAHKLHPLTKLPTGYRWLRPFEKIPMLAKYTRSNSPKWQAVTAWGGSYDPKAYHAMACPSHSDKAEAPSLSEVDPPAAG